MYKKNFDKKTKVSFAITNPAVPGLSNIRGLTRIFTSVWNTIYIVGGLALLLYLLFGALTYLTSAGDKDQLERAKKTLTNAVMGLAIIAVSYPIVVIIGKVLGVDILNISWPTP